MVIKTIIALLLPSIEADTGENGKRDIILAFKNLEEVIK